MNIGAIEVLGIVVLFALAAVPARIAQDKGRRFWTWYALGLLFFFPALIVSLLLPDKISAGSVFMRELLQEIQAHPGSTQEQLATRIGVGPARLLDPLLQMRSEGLVQLMETGESFSIGRHLAPVVKVYPAPSAARGRPPHGLAQV